MSKIKAIKKLSEHRYEAIPFDGEIDFRSVQIEELSLKINEIIKVLNKISPIITKSKKKI